MTDALVALSAATGHAAIFSWTNYLKFRTGFALPGVELPAGVYAFTGFTTRVARPAGLPKGRLVIFGETARGSAQPIRVWFPIDSSTGHQFLY